MAEDSFEQRSKEYSKIKNRLEVIGIFLPVILLVIFLFTGLSLKLRDFVEQATVNPYLVVAIYFIILGWIFYLIGFPLGFFEGFVLEHKFGLSNQKFISWAWDEVKEILISFVLYLPMVELIYIFLRKFPTTWWMFTGAFWITISILLSKFLPVILIPLFYKQTPLKDEELKQRLFLLAEKAGAKIKDIFEIDLSKKTKKANAALCGMGKTKRILLGDTLLSGYSKDEIEVVMAHELGHHKLKHIWKLLFFASIATFLGLYLAGIFLAKYLAQFGFRDIYDVAAFPLLGMVLFMVGLLIMPLQNGYSRKLEKNADKFAIESTNKPDAFISAMTKLWKQNLRDASPGKMTEIFLYDHPPISKRVKMAEKYRV